MVNEQRELIKFRTLAIVDRIVRANDNGRRALDCEAACRT